MNSVIRPTSNVSIPTSRRATCSGTIRGTFVPFAARAIASSAPTVNRSSWIFRSASRTGFSFRAEIAIPRTAFNSSTAPIASTRGSSLATRSGPNKPVSPSSHPLFRIGRCGGRREDRRLYDVREDLQTVYEPRTRPIEKARTIDEPHPLVSGRGHVRPPRCSGHRRRLCPSAIEVEPTRHEDRHLGQGRCDFLRRDAAGFFSRTSKRVDASCEADHFRNPVSSDKEGIQPFEARRSRTFGGQGGLARDAFNS